MVAVAGRRPTDDELAERTVANDPQAFATLFGRHLAGVYDVVFRMLRDDQAALEAIEAGFARAWDAMRTGRSDNPRACIYTAACTSAAARAHRARRAANPSVQSEDAPALTAFDPSRLADPLPVVQDPELVRLVWKSAAALEPSEYALLDLQLRKGLAPHELARELGVRTTTLEARLARLKDKLTQSVRTARNGSDSSRASPLAVFAALAPVALPPRVHDALVARLAERRETPPKRWRPSRLVLVVAAILALAGAVTGVVAAVVVSGGGPRDPADFRSTTHRIGVRTSDASIRVTWTPRRDARGYSILWSPKPASPDETVDLAENQAGASRVVVPGTWWFNLRTRGEGGAWTDGVHVGPYLVVAVPNTTFAVRPRQLSNDATPAFRLDATGPGTFECSLDGRPFQRCRARTATRQLRNGRHRLEARVRDRYGNADASPAVWVWRIDTKAPSTQVVSAQFEKRKALFHLSAGERGARFECRLDDDDYRGCHKRLLLRALSQGDHVLLIRATDAAGNTDRTPVVERWKVDTKRPKTTIVSGPAGDVNRRKAKFVLDANEDGVTFECSLDGAAFGSCGPNVVYTGLALGEHTFKARATDEEANVDRTPVKRSWTVVDTTPPQTTISSHPGISSSDSSPRFTFRSSEAGSRFECRLDGRAWRSCSSPKAYSGLSSGQHVFRVRARDASGNVDRTPASWTWTIH
jgi:RNA polymerase sigma factor (sigma-70 family)